MAAAGKRDIVIGRNGHTSCFAAKEPDTGDEVIGEREAAMVSIFTLYRRSFVEHTKHHLGTLHLVPVVNDAHYLGEYRVSTFASAAWSLPTTPLSIDKVWVRSRPRCFWSPAIDSICTASSSSLPICLSHLFPSP
jgi:hypothetical protein